MTQGSQKPNSVFPLGVVIHCSLIQCLLQLYRTELTQKVRMNCMYIYTHLGVTLVLVLRNLINLVFKLNILNLILF